MAHKNITVLAGCIDRVVHLKSGDRFIGKVYVFHPMKEVVSIVYGKTLEEMRNRKRTIVAALKALNKK